MLAQNSVQGGCSGRRRREGRAGRVRGVAAAVGRAGGGGGGARGGGAGDGAAVRGQGAESYAPLNPGYQNVCWRRRSSARARCGWAEPWNPDTTYGLCWCGRQRVPSSACLGGGSGAGDSAAVPGQDLKVHPIIPNCPFTMSAGDGAAVRGHGTAVLSCILKRHASAGMDACACHAHLTGSLAAVGVAVSSRLPARMQSIKSRAAACISAHNSDEGPAQRLEDTQKRS